MILYTKFVSVNVSADFKKDGINRDNAQTPIKSIKGTEQPNKTINPLPLTNEMMRPISDELRQIIKIFTNILSLLPPTGYVLDLRI